MLGPFGLVAMIVIMILRPILSVEGVPQRYSTGMFLLLLFGSLVGGSLIVGLLSTHVLILNLNGRWVAILVEVHNLLVDCKVSLWGSWLRLSR